LGDAAERAQSESKARSEKPTHVPKRFCDARRQVHRAIARGELETAFRWTLIMREQVDIERHYNDLIGARPDTQTATPKAGARRQALHAGRARSERFLTGRHAQLAHQFSTAGTRRTSKGALIRIDLAV